MSQNVSNPYTNDSCCVGSHFQLETVVFFCRTEHLQKLSQAHINFIKTFIDIILPTHLLADFQPSRFSQLTSLSSKTSYLCCHASAGALARLKATSRRSSLKELLLGSCRVTSGSPEMAPTALDPFVRGSLTRWKIKNLPFVWITEEHSLKIWAFV